MKIEKLRNNHKKKIIIGGMILVGLLSTLILTTTRAKYKTTQSINIVNGTINYKPYDLKVLAMYNQKEGSYCTEDRCYEEITGRMPSSGYVINESKSYCALDGTNKDMGVVLKTINGEHVIRNLSKNEKCKLYFDKIKVTNIQELITYSHINIGSPDFSKAATTDEGMYQASDGMYGGTSYYWRGAATNNHVIFANFCWRTVRINGDSTIRLIYNGAIQSENACHDNGSWDGSVVIGSNDSENYYATSDGKCNNSSCVGWTYTLDKQRPDDNTTAISSNAKTQTEKWFNNHIGNNTTYLSKVADGKYCNDRNTGQPFTVWNWSEYTTWSATGTRFAYAATDRVLNKYRPTLSCPKGDVYTLKVGAITADEAEFAGGKNENNTSYYLYNGQNYWTMSPRNWDGWAYVFSISSNGYLLGDSVNKVYSSSIGVRPVINLKADTVFAAGGLGTVDKPYVVQ